MSRGEPACQAGNRNPLNPVAGIRTRRAKRLAPVRLRQVDEPFSLGDVLMYSVVMMMALTAGGDAPAFGRGNGCFGCNGSSCYGASYSCHGGGLFSRGCWGSGHSCHGGYSCHGASYSCLGSGHSCNGCWGGASHGCWGNKSCNGCWGGNSCHGGLGLFRRHHSCHGGYACNGGYACHGGYACSGGYGCHGGVVISGTPAAAAPVAETKTGEMVGTLPAKKAETPSAEQTASEKKWL